MKPTIPLILAALISGCTTAPRHTEHAPPIVAHNENASAASAASGSAATSPEVNQDLLKQGYKATQRRGELVYCRQQQVTGTLFLSSVCLTEEQIKENERRAREQLESVHQGSCGSNCH